MMLKPEPADVGERVDVWLCRRLPELSRARIQALIRGGSIAAPGRALRPNSRVVSGMEVEVTVPPPEPVRLEPEAIPLSIIFEDRDIVVVDKPAGLVVHPAAGHAAGTLVNALLHHCRDLQGIGGELRPGIVHRLDRDTTGVMIAAKNQAAMDALSGQFKAGAVRKEYVALVHGVPAPREGRVETVIGRNPSDRMKMSARVAVGRRAVTRYRVAESFGAVSLVEVTIETGRTHQIRVHMAHMGHPVVGDPQYGSRRRDRGFGAGRQMLHARLLGLRHPRTNEPAVWTAPIPSDFQALLSELRKGPSR